MHLTDTGWGKGHHFFINGPIFKIQSVLEMGHQGLGISEPKQLSEIAKVAKFAETDGAWLAPSLE